MLIIDFRLGSDTPLPVDHMFEIKNKIYRFMYRVCSKLTVKTNSLMNFCHSVAANVNFEEMLRS